MVEQRNNPSPQVKWWRRPVLWASIAVAIVILITIGTLSVRAGAYSFQTQSLPLKKGPLMIITNSGSTNRPGSTLTINTDGSGLLQYQRENCSCVLDDTSRFANKTFPVGTFDVAQLANLLAQVGDVSAIPNHPCLKSISFGSTTTITYQGKTSGDVSCLSNADQKIYLDVKEAVQTMYTQALKG